jgi:hypothetical protein
MSSPGIGGPGDGGLELLLLDDAIEHDAQDSGARDGALKAEVIKPLQLALRDHDGDGCGGRQHREQAGNEDRLRA